MFPHLDDFRNSERNPFRYRSRIAPVSRKRELSPQYGLSVGSAFCDAVSGERETRRRADAHDRKLSNEIPLVQHAGQIRFRCVKNEVSSFLGDSSGILRTVAGFF